MSSHHLCKCLQWLVVARNNLNTLAHLRFDTTCMHQWTYSSLLCVKDWCLFGSKPLPKPVLTFCQLGPYEQNLMTFLIWTTWTPMSAVPKKAVKLNHSLTRWYFYQNTIVFIQEYAFEMFSVKGLPFYSGLNVFEVNQTVTHWGRYKMADIFQTTLSIAFSWMKMYEFRLKFTEVCS